MEGIPWNTISSVGFLEHGKVVEGGMVALQG